MPPVTVRLIVPFDAPHVAGVGTAVNTIPGIVITVALTTDVQPLTSVTVRVYVPATTLLRSCVTAPFDQL